VDRKFVVGLARDWLAALVVVFVGLTLFNGLFSGSPLSGGSAPEFALEDLDGSVVRLADFQDEVVVLNFWFTSCGACRTEIPHLAEFHEKNPDFPLFGINVDDFDAKRLKRLSEKLEVTYPVLRDTTGATAASYGVSLYPTTFILRNGEIVSTSQGVLSLAGLEAELARVGGS
jgi:thiol-disulfide isomerase/thioredoxin